MLLYFSCKYISCVSFQSVFVWNDILNVNVQLLLNSLHEALLFAVLRRDHYTVRSIHMEGDLSMYVFCARGNQLNNVAFIKKHSYRGTFLPLLVSSSPSLALSDIYVNLSVIHLLKNKSLKKGLLPNWCHRLQIKNKIIWQFDIISDIWQVDIIHISNDFEGDIPECNIFELVFTLCHKCNRYNCLPWKC